MTARRWTAPKRLGLAVAALAFAAGLGAAATGVEAQATGVGGAPAQSIVAVVNEDAITSHELTARLALVMLVSGIDDSAEARRELAPRVLRTLIDERLQMQEAARLGIVVPPEDIRAALTQIERQNRMPPGALPEMLYQRGVDLGTLVRQITATLAWQNVVQIRVQPQVEVGEEEVDAYLAELRERGGTTEWSVSEIFLAIDDPRDRAAVRRTAQSILEQIRAGVPFEALASQFSDSSTASIGGDLGVVQSGQLDQRVEEAIERLQPGQIGGPIEVDTGVYIVALHDRREIRPPRPEDDTVELRRLFFPLPEGAPAEKVERADALARGLMGTLRNCSDMMAVAREVEPGGNPVIGPLKIGSLPPALQQIVKLVEVNEPAGPIRLDDGLIVFMVCNRSPGQGDLPGREAVMQSLGQQRVDMRARRLLSDLRAAAFIDIRI